MAERDGFMDYLNKWLEINEAREKMYRLLARFYRIEADEEMLEQLAQMKFPQDCPREMAEGYKLLQAAVSAHDDKMLENLAVDYARVFLGAGIINFDAAYPYESVYLSEKKLIMQEPRDEVVTFYRSCGVDRSHELSEPEDHIAFELEFMAYLCGEAAEFARQGNEAKMQQSLNRQQEFLQKHLLKWQERFCNDVLKYAGTDFYRGAARITGSYLAMESALLNDEAMSA